MLNSYSIWWKYFGFLIYFIFLFLGKASDNYSYWYIAVYLLFFLLTERNILFVLPNILKGAVPFYSFIGIFGIILVCLLGVFGFIIIVIAIFILAIKITLDSNKEQSKIVQNTFKLFVKKTLFLVLIATIFIYGILSYIFLDRDKSVTEVFSCKSKDKPNSPKILLSTKEKSKYNLGTIETKISMLIEKGFSKEQIHKKLKNHPDYRLLVKEDNDKFNKIFEEIRSSMN